MTAVLILGIIFGSILAFVIIIFGFILAMAKIKKGGSFRGGEQLQANETKLIQELHQGLTKMEERIEALETLLLDRDARSQGKESKE
jgi:phage shock protein B